MTGTTVRAAARAARAATRVLAGTDGAQRDGVLRAAAALLRARSQEILAANEADVAAAGALEPSARARLVLDEGRLEQMARALHALAGLPDPLGRVDLHRRLDDGLELTRSTVPIGVIGVIFESRPDAAVQIGGLAIKSGNAVLLKGGREAAASVEVLVDVLRTALAQAGLPADTVQRLADRAAVDELLDLAGDVDLVVPRGSKQLVRSIQARTRIPVLGHADGICHVYLDAAADPAMAVGITHDAKLQYPAACNAVETLLVHADAAPTLLPLVAADLVASGVELRGDARARELVPMAEATLADWDSEYGEPVLSVRVVESVDAVLAHVAEHGSGHTEVIVTQDAAVAERFLREVDAAGVFHNASSRFADGYRYGFGAEVGISTGRLHARGPVGLEGLVTSKYVLRGGGHVVADYAAGARSFAHQDLPVGPHR